MNLYLKIIMNLHYDCYYKLNKFYNFNVKLKSKFSFINHKYFRK